MVTQPYTAQISKGTDFTKTIEIPHLLNYTIPVDDAIVSVGSDGMSLQGYAGISLNEKDSTISFDLKAVTEDVAVTLYYVAGKGKYTVNHYHQNLENDEYTLDRSDIVVNGDIDAYTEAVADIVPGYHCKGVEQSTIAADGTTKVDITTVISIQLFLMSTAVSTVQSRFTQSSERLLKQIQFKSRPARDIHSSDGVRCFQTLLLSKKI